jgi:L-fuculose-phosphate aldolase
MNESSLRREIVKYSHLVWQQGYLVSMDGNLSVRLDDNHFLVTKAGCHKGFLSEDDVVVVDAKGQLVRGEGRPTSEVFMHLAVYEERPDVRAVIHTHPPHAIAFTLANKSLERLVLPEVVLTIGTIPTVPYVTTGTKALADSLRPAIQTRDALILDRHGAVTVGTTLHEAFCKLETLEHTAKVLLISNSLGGTKELPAEESVQLRSMGLKRYGGPPQSVSMADNPRADLPEASFRPSDPYPEPTTMVPRVASDAHLVNPAIRLAQMRAEATRTSENINRTRNALKKRT